MLEFDSMTIEYQQAERIRASTSSQLMDGKRGLVVGVANNKSIAWGIAEFLAEHGADLAFTYQSRALEKRVRPLAESVGASIVEPCDVESEKDIERVIATVASEWENIDFSLYNHI